MPRTILVHLNVEVADDAPCTASDVADEVRGALDVGTDPDQTPALATYGAAITLAEEV